MLLGLTVSLWAQESFTVTGTVTDDKNEPLVGVSVVIADNPGLGAITDLDGKYSIKGVTQYSKLVYTYIGYTKAERMVRNQRVINVKLKEAVAAEEYEKARIAFSKFASESKKGKPRSKET